MSPSESPIDHASGTKSAPIWKIALIPLLTIVLVWSLTSGSKRDVDAATVEQPDAGSETTSSPAALARSAEVSVSANAARSWPDFDAADVTNFDPFALRGKLEHRASLPVAVTTSNPSASENTASQNRSLLQEAASHLKLQGIFNGKNGPAALIDSRIVRIGDEIEPGFRVVEISQAGIIVEPIEAL